VTQPSAELETGSFRDRDSRVFYRSGGVYRGLSAQGLSEWERLSSAAFFPRLIEQGKVVETELIERSECPDPALAETWEAVLKHRVIPFVSYPYEWSFGMLKDAALLQLELLAAALEEDMVLKDATPYNVQWDGARPVFIDIPSFIDLKPGEPWPGYRQFCELFLYPLFLQAYKNAPFHPWLRGSIDGISAEHCRGLMSFRDLWRSGVFMHVSLQAALQAKFAGTEKDVKKELKASGFHKELIQINVRKLTKLVSKLEWKQGQSTWSDYVSTNTYDEANRKRKADFVRKAVEDRPRDLVWDLGCNTGEYSRIASESAGYVVSMDADHLAVERMYQALKAEGNKKILPLTVNLADPSPNIGWRGGERKELRSRGAPDLTLALALIHHIVIGANIPLREFIDSLAALGSDLVIEFVSKEDSMTKALLRNKEDKYTDYDQSVLEESLEAAFEIVSKETLGGETRTLYYARRRR
jgi:hypothetical protein